MHTCNDGVCSAACCVKNLRIEAEKRSWDPSKESYPIRNVKPSNRYNKTKQLVKGTTERVYRL